MKEEEGEGQGMWRKMEAEGRWKMKEDEGTKRRSREKCTPANFIHCTC